MPDQLPTAPDATRANALIAALEWLYDKVAPANPAKTPGPTTDTHVERLIAVACTSAGTTGFVTNVGGLITLPVALPANLLGVAAIQLRLISDIAAARGYNATSPEVRTIAFVCLTGGAAVDILKEVGIKLGQQAGHQLLNRIAGSAVATSINKAVGFRLLANAGSKGMVNLTKFVPVLGGVIGGTVDAISTRAVGAVAKRAFPRVDVPIPAPEPPPILLPATS